MQSPEAVRGADVDARPDAELVERAREGDGGAFRTIMQRHNRRLYRVARSIVRSDSDAEDIVQEAYLHAFASLGTFRAESSLATWLTRITLNEALGRLRRQRPTVDLATLDLDEADTQRIIPFPHMASTATDPERTVAQREIRRMIERAIDNLPEAFRVVFVLREIEELSVEETAAFLGVNAATVKTRLHRGRRLLRQALDEQLASALTDAFPFDGARCTRMADRILDRLGLAG